jgi:hypothetical protein
MMPEDSPVRRRAPAAGDAVPEARLTTDGEGGEHEGQVRFDGVALAVEDGAGVQVGLGHPGT